MGFRDLIGPGRFIDPAVIQASAERGDDWYPHAEARPLPEATSQPRRSATTTFVLHTMAGPGSTTPDSLWRWHARQDVRGECTWILGFDGQCIQAMPVEVRVDTHYKANAFATSVETQDNGYEADPDIAKTPWTDHQLAQLAGLSAWQALHPRLDVPLRRADRGWNGGGIDGHRRYSEWSIYTGKTCPGQARWEQIPEVLDAARDIATWTPPDPTEDDMHQKIYLAYKKNDRSQLWRGDGYRSTRLDTATQTGLEGRSFDDPRMQRYYNPATGERLTSWLDVPGLTPNQIIADVGTPEN